MRHPFFYAVIVFIIFSGCSSRNKSSIPVIKINENDFSSSVQLKEIPIIGVNNHLVNPDFCDIQDSILIIVEKNTPPYFKFFSLNNFRYLGSYGGKGEGPGEISFFPTMIHQDRKDIKPLSFQFYDWGKKRLAKLFLSKALKNSKAEPKIYYVLPPDLIYAQRVAYLNDSTIVGAGGITMGKLFFDNLKAHTIDYTPFIPKIKQHIDMRDLGQLYFGYFTIDHLQRRIAMVSQYFKQLEVYNFSGKLLSVTSFKNTPPPIFYHNNMVTSDKTMRYYYDILSTNKYIYAGYFGKPQGDLNQLGSKKFTTQIQVFNWNGEPVKKYILNAYLRSFILDLRHNRILGIAPYNKESPLVAFDLK